MPAALAVALVLLPKSVLTAPPAVPPAVPPPIWPPPTPPPSLPPPQMPPSVPTVVVGPSDTTQWRTTLDEALSNAAISRIEFVSGTYLLGSSIVIRRSVTVVAAEGSAGTVVLDAQGRGRVIEITRGSDSPLSVSLSWLSLTGGAATHGAGLKIHSTVTAAPPGDLRVDMVACVVYNNTAGEGDVGNGGGLHIKSAIANLTGCNVSDNRVSMKGAGLYVDVGGSSVVWLDTSVVRNNIASGHSDTDGPQGQGGGLFVDEPTSDVYLISCDVCDNVATNFGGGIWASCNMIAIIRCNIHGNSATNFHVSRKH